MFHISVCDSNYISQIGQYIEIDRLVIPLLRLKQEINGMVYDSLPTVPFPSIRI